MYSYVTSVEEESRKRNGSEVLAIVAKKEIREMETLNETMLEFKSIPKRYLEPSAISLEKKEEDKDSTKSLKALAGNIAIVPIRRGEQLTYNKITDPSGRTGLATQVTPGKRAFSVPVSEITGVSKLIKPGDRVDLIAVIDAGGGKENKVVKTVLQDIVVLATGHYITNNVARSVEVDRRGFYFLGSDFRA
jgi:pilus assembly protein CpaB